MNDGGPAFAIGIPASPPEHGIYFQSGMTLRDYFAAKAMQAIIAKSPFLDNPQTFEVYQKTAIGAYDYADAMLAHRSK